VLQELAELREDARGLARDLAVERWRRAAGLPAETPLRELVKAHRLATSPDGLAQARETLERALAEDPRRPARIARLTALRDLLIRARALALEPGAAQELWELQRRPLVRLAGDAGLHGALPAVAVERELPLVRAREKRAEMERALAAALQPADRERGAAWEAAQAALGEAGVSSDGSAAELAESFLRETEGTARDLGGWLLERHTGAKPYPSGAERHDVLHLLHAPRCAGAFPRGEMVRTVRRWAEMLRLDLSEVKVDDDDRPLKEWGSRAEPIDPPWEVRVSVLPEEGPRALASLLGAVSVAQLRAGPASDAPPEDLWLGEHGVVWACRALLEGLVREREFVRRCAKADLPRDDERAIAIAAVIDARLAAARTLGSLAAHELGLGGRAAQASREAFARATGAELPAGLALAQLDPWLEPAAELRGRALASRMREFLRELYDEDWWRNPRSLPSLNGLWARGGRNTMDELWTEVGGEPGVQALATELAEACR
jgi:hypothetical protein